MSFWDILKKKIKKIWTPFYRPFKHKVGNRFARLRQQLWDMDGHICDVNENVQQHGFAVKKFDDRLEDLEQRLAEQTKLIQELSRFGGLDEQLKKSENNILQTMDGRIWKSELHNMETIQNNVSQLMSFQQSVFETQKNGQSKYLFVNDTFNTFHHGSSATSLAIRYYLTQKQGNDILNIPMPAIEPNQNIYPRNIYDFGSIEFYEKWKMFNQSIIAKIINCEHVIVNGEGCISHYNPGTLNLLYIIYLSKKVFKKKTSIINHSIFTSNYVDQLTDTEQNDFKKIISLVYSILDTCYVREPYSLQQLHELLPVKGEQCFDCLPLYVNDLFPFKGQKSIKYITISGGNFLGEWYAEFINAIVPILKQKFSGLPVVFLFSEIPYAAQTGDMEIYKKIETVLGKNNISLFSVQTTDEWLSVIQNSSVFISGRFHHSIASFMLDTPFLCFKTDTKKLEGMLEMIEKAQNLLESDNVQKAVDKAKELLDSEEFYKENNSALKTRIINLAENNFNNL